MGIQFTVFGCMHKHPGQFESCANSDIRACYRSCSLRAKFRKESREKLHSRSLNCLREQVPGKQISSYWFSGLYKKRVTLKM